MKPRVRSDLLVSGLLAQVQAQGDFGAVLNRGDRERGDVLVIMTERGQAKAVLGRQLGANGDYSWARLADVDSSGSDSLAPFIAQRQRFDPDLWIVELDIADSQRFIAERLSD